MMQNYKLYGARVEVMSGEGGLCLGYGTYLGELRVKALGGELTPRILLDTRESIYGYQCFWAHRPDLAPTRPFDYFPQWPLRLFTAAGGIMLGNTGKKLASHGPVKVLRFEHRDYDHRPQVAALINVGSHEYYLLAEEMPFPRFGE